MSLWEEKGVFVHVFSFLSPLQQQQQQQQQRGAFSHFHPPPPDNPNLVYPLKPLVSAYSLQQHHTS